MAEKIEIIIEGTDKASGPLGKVTGAISSIGTIAVAAAATATAAIVGVAVSGAMAFVGFQGSMNEVFTLLPGISQDAMSAMSDQVLQFSQDFAVLPEEVVPALYQAISAGVPPDNVFTFLETAQMAAVGGVTELETAVDGITSVVNAYGAEVLGASAASDIMFTAVRLGKTDFEQLSTSLFNVIPTAAAAGVSFGDVAAQLATITAQGTPTSVATTQIRAALVEAQKSGTLLSDAINELTGQSFTELIAQGETMPEIFQALRESMPEQAFKDLFGSVEAMNAVLGITGPNFDTVTAAMNEMNDSTGATEAAFETMSGGLGFTIDKLKAFGQTALIQIGEALAPFLALILRLAENALPHVSEVLGRVSDAFGRLAEIITTSGFEYLFVIFEDGSSYLESFMITLGMGEEPARQLATAIINIVNGIREFISAAVEFLTPIVEAVTQFVSWKDVLVALGIAIAAVVIPAIYSIVSAVAPVIAVGIALVAAIALVRNAWENDWGGIRTFIVNAWETSIKPAIEQLVAWLQVNIPIAMQALKDFWETTLQPALQSLATWFGENIPIAMAAISNFWNNVLQPAFVVLGTWLQTNLPIALQALSNFWTNVLLPAITAVANWMQGTLFPTLQTVATWLGETIPPIIQNLADFWENVLLPAITLVWDFITTDLVPLFQTLGELLEVTLTLALTVLQGAWENILLPAIQAVWAFIQDNVIPIFEALIEKLGPPLQGPIEAVKGLFDGFKAGLEGVSGIIQTVIGWLQTLIETLGNIEIPEILTPGSPTPFEMGLRGILSTVRELNPELDSLRTAMTGNIQSPIIGPLGTTAAIPGSGAVGITNNNFNMTVHTGADVATVSRDFQLMAAMVGG